MPESRTDLTVPFGVAGVDFCGPFYTRVPRSTGRRKKEQDIRSRGRRKRPQDGAQNDRPETTKSYVALFTCGSTRAVHLELVPAQDALQTHLAVRRFLATYPGCRRLISDNGASFVKAATDLKRVFRSMRDPEVLEVLNGRSIDWTMICPRAPWHGGFYERMVGVIKSALIKTLGRALVTFEEFRTILLELAAVINDRPITAVPAEADAPSALTPAQFLRGGPHDPALAAWLPVDRLLDDGKTTGGDLRKEYAKRSAYFRQLSVRWFREYLLQLRSAQTRKGAATRPIQVGEVCVLKEDNKPRILWQLVRIIEQHKGRDGQVRVYTVRFPNRRTSRRAAQLLYPLEMESEDMPAGSTAERGTQQQESTSW